MSTRMSTQGNWTLLDDEQHDALVARNKQLEEAVDAASRILSKAPVTDDSLLQVHIEFALRKLETARLETAPLGNESGGQLPDAERSAIRSDNLATITANNRPT